MCRSFCEETRRTRLFVFQGFRSGLAKYLKDFEYKNATTIDLWSHFEKATGKPVSAIMSDWTRKKGWENDFRESVDLGFGLVLLSYIRNGMWWYLYVLYIEGYLRRGQERKLGVFQILTKNFLRTFEKVPQVFALGFI